MSPRRFSSTSFSIVGFVETNTSMHRQDTLKVATFLFFMLHLKSAKQTAEKFSRLSPKKKEQLDESIKEGTRNSPPSPLPQLPMPPSSSSSSSTTSTYSWSVHLCWCKKLQNLFFRKIRWKSQSHPTLSAVPDRMCELILCSSQHTMLLFSCAF